MEPHSYTIRSPPKERGPCHQEKEHVSQAKLGWNIWRPSMSVISAEFAPYRSTRSSWNQTSLATNQATGSTTTAIAVPREERNGSIRPRPSASNGCLISQPRPVWNCQDGLPPQKDPPSTTPVGRFEGTDGSPMECLGMVTYQQCRVVQPGHPLHGTKRLVDCRVINTHWNWTSSELVSPVHIILNSTPLQESLLVNSTGLFGI